MIRMCARKPSFLKFAYMDMSYGYARYMIFFISSILVSNFCLNKRATMFGRSGDFCPCNRVARISLHLGLHVNVTKRSGMQNFRILQNLIDTVSWQFFVVLKVFFNRPECKSRWIVSQHGYHKSFCVSMQKF